ncbi:MAG: tetratricopeptide repeat protein [Blastocatellia bacterium]
MTPGHFQLFHPGAIRDLAIRRDMLPRPLVMPGYMRAEERERLVTLLLGCLAAAGMPSAEVIRLSWQDRERLDAGARPLALSLESNDLLWLVVETPVEHADLYRFVDAVDALTLIDMRVQGGDEYVQWLAVLKTSLLSAAQSSWRRHAQHGDTDQVNFHRAGAWYESPIDALDYANHLATGLFSGSSLSYAERLAAARVLAARAATLSAKSLRALLYFAMRERLDALRLDEAPPDYAAFYPQWRDAGLGWLTGAEFTPLPALERLAEIEVVSMFAAEWPRGAGDFEPFHRLRDQLHKALSPPDVDHQPHFLGGDLQLRPGVPLNTEGTCGQPEDIRAAITPVFPALAPDAEDQAVQEAMMAETDTPRRHLLLAWRATLWLDAAATGGADKERQAENAVTRALHDIQDKLDPRGANPLARQAASAWARLRCVIADGLCEQARVARAAELIPMAMNHYTSALAVFRDLGDIKNQAEVLHQMADVIAPRGEPTRALDLWREALALFEKAGDLKSKAATLHQMAGVIAQQGDVQRAFDLWDQSLRLSEQIGDVKGKAATLNNMALVFSQQGDVQRALDLWNQSLLLKEQIGDVQGKAATLHNMADVIAQQGDVQRALDLWNQSLLLKEQIGDVQGKAASLNNMAFIIAQQDGVQRALDLWNQSLVLMEQIGDVQGKAATLTSMALAAGKQGDAVEERRLNVAAARALALVRAWLDLVTVLRNLGASGGDEATGYLAQALWIALRAGVPMHHAVNLAARLLEQITPAADAAPMMAAAALWFARTRGEAHPQREQYQQGAFNMLVNCARARGISTQEDFDAWVAREGLTDPARVVPALSVALEGMVAPDGWLFDRALFGAGAD